MIDSLIDKQDNFEIIRDQIAAILKTESESQQALAVLAGKDPDLWKLRVFIERSNPWEEWLNSQDDKSPIINVWYDNSNFDLKASNLIERQKSSSIFNIDMYGYGLSEDDPDGGHKPGDRQAALDVQRAIKLVRNILMAGTYTYLDLRGLVWRRWPQSINVFQPQLDSTPIQQIVGARMAFNVDFNEFSPQVPFETLELISVTVDATTGELYFEADYEH